ncbi:MAG: zinc-binding dehydrogenase [Halodesulfurarchaeum sp.]
METRVAYLDVGEITMDTVELPELGPNDVLVKTEQASVCGSERYFYRGITVRPEDKARGLPSEAGDYHRDGEKHTYPIGPLGHEGGGTIESVGSAVDTYLGGGTVSVGDRVGSLYYPTYTDYWVTDVSNVQPIPDGVSFRVGALYEALACAVWAARHMDVKLGDTVAVNGLGFAGNVLLQGALQAGASEVYAIDPVEEKRDIAEELGADVTIDPTEEDAVELVDELTDYDGVDVAVEAVGGTGIGIKQALGMVAHNGVLALYGDNYAPIDDFCFHKFHEDALTVQNLAPMHYTQLQSIENAREAYRAVERGIFDVDVILEHSESYSLDELPEVFEKEAESTAAQTSLKTIIEP